MKVVLDTNIFISLLLGSPQTIKVKNALENDQAIFILSPELRDELLDVIDRPKFNRIISTNDKKDLIVLLDEKAIIVNPVRKVNDCRDAKDNIVLECALQGKADFIVTGDKDLLCLHPFHGIKIVALKQFNKMLS